jgi:HEXXH motif-containing protein
MGDPLVGAWLARTTRRLREAQPAPAPLMGDLFHLSNLAAAAALRLRIDCRVTGYARHGRLTFPGLGTAILADGYEGLVGVKVSAGTAQLDGPFGERTVPATADGWLDVRWLTGSHGALTCSVRVEDSSPYRDGYHAPPSDRLPDDEVRAWQELFAQAWELISRFLPVRAGEIATGLRAVVPLRNDEQGSARSGTARDSVGALGLTRPQSPEDFTITIIHEYQHSKLSAVLDLMPLYAPGGKELHFAPWRVDARPTAGLIQGVYAFLGVAEAWNALRAAPGIEHTATCQFAIVREQVRTGLAALEGSTELTAAGRHFTAGMREAFTPLLDAPVPEEALEEGRAALSKRWSAWRTRHPVLAAEAGSPTLP